MASKNKGLLIVFSGPSGSGKDTVLAELKSRKINLRQSISVTTRNMRDGEVDGVDYYFTSVQEFEKNIEEGYFLNFFLWCTIIIFTIFYIFKEITFFNILFKFLDGGEIVIHAVYLAITHVTCSYGN